jgi:hypothetical protein
VTTLSLPYSNFFDQIESLDSALDLAQSAFGSSQGLSLSLPSLLMWHDEFTYAWAVKNQAQFLWAFYDKYVYAPVPPHPLTPETLFWAFDYMARVNGPGPGISRIEGLTELDLKTLPSHPYLLRRTSTEYLYDRSQVSSLHGDGFRSQRALVNRWLREKEILFRPYRVPDLKACGELNELWKSQRLPVLQGQIGESMIRSSQKAHLRALLLGETWGLSTWVVFRGERLVAYTAAAPLQRDTLGVFLEVADLTLKGLSAYVFSTLCRQWEGYAYVNTGDAEGLPHLAESKEHWHPLKKLALYALDPL